MDAKGWFASHARPSAARLTAYEIFKPAPAGALDIDIQIEKFAERNASKRLVAEEWSRLWQSWCHQAVAFATRRTAP